MIGVISVAVGIVVGVVVGRWWALSAAVAVGVWVMLSTGVDEVPPWFLGLAYGAFTGAGIVLGIMLRRGVRRTGQRG
jgi:hypothetical protein